MSLSQSFARNASPKMDPVQFALNQAGANLATSGYTNTAAGNTAAIEKSAGALQQFQEAKAALSAQLPENRGAANEAKAGGLGTTIASQAIGIGATAIAAVAAPPVAAVAATIAVGAAVMDGLRSLATVNTAIDGGGEMGLHERSSSSKDEGMTHYTDSMGDTYSMSGQPMAAPIAQQPSQPIIDPRRMKAAVDATFEQFTPDEIRDSIANIGALEKAHIASLGANFKKMGINANVGKSYAELNDEHKKLDLDTPELGLIRKGPAANTPSYLKMGMG